MSVKVCLDVLDNATIELGGDDRVRRAVVTAGVALLLADLVRELTGEVRKVVLGRKPPSFVERTERLLDELRDAGLKQRLQRERIRLSRG